MYLLILVCKPFESLVVFKELSEGAEEDAKLLELEIVVPVLPLTLNILSRMKRICNHDDKILGTFANFLQWWNARLMAGRESKRSSELITSRTP